MKFWPALFLSIITVLLSDFLTVCIVKFGSDLLSYEVVTFKEVLTEPILLWGMIIATILMIPFITWGLMYEEE